MKYAVMAEITLDTETKREKGRQAIKDKIVGQPLWANERNPTTIADTESREGKPALSVILRFEDKDDRNELALFLEDLIIQTPALSGEVKIHKCFHDEGNIRPCEEEVL